MTLLTLVTATVLNQPPSPLAMIATLPFSATLAHCLILLRTTSSGEFQKVMDKSSITNINGGYPIGIPFNFESDLFKARCYFVYKVWTPLMMNKVMRITLMDRNECFRL
eukprot:15324303-Ditylum_brightwellii.AAC.1